MKTQSWRLRVLGLLLFLVGFLASFLMKSAIGVEIGLALIIMAVVCAVGAEIMTRFERLEKKLTELKSQ